VQQFAQSWLVYDLTKDAFYLGLDLFLGQMPIMLFSLVGGVFADRLERRRLLLYSQYIQMSCAFVLTALFATHAVRVWHILTLSFVVGVGQSFGGPAYSALLPTLVEPEDLANAIPTSRFHCSGARGHLLCLRLDGVGAMNIQVMAATLPLYTVSATVRVEAWWSKRRHLKANNSLGRRAFVISNSSRMRSRRLSFESADLS
jgi:MFS family permease